MSTTVNYVDNVRDQISLVVGKSAPTTGEYYSHVYSGQDINTRVPIIGVDLHRKLDTKPLSLSGVRDAASLDIVLNDQTTEPSTDHKNINTVTAHLQATTTALPTTQSIIDGGGALPLGGVIVLILLLGLSWFIYNIVRIWQNNIAHKALIRNSTSTTTPIVEIPKDTMVPITPTVNEKSATTSNAIVNTQPNHFNINTIEQDLSQNDPVLWRQALSTLDSELLKLLSDKGISGESISDKLKAVSAGDFAMVDIAWEAHQTAKNLLSMHDNELKTQDLTRGFKLFKQVFAEHGVI